MKRLTCAFLFVILCVSCVFGQSPKYVFLFIGDGMGPNQRALAEKVSVQAGLGELEMNHFPAQGNAITSSANAKVTDSAAAGTAIATGVKTDNAVLGMSPAKQPVYSVAVDAKNAGWKVGIISSVYINHATPAAFYAHVKHRDMYDEISAQLPVAGFDFFGASGFCVKKITGDEACNLAKAAGYNISLGKLDQSKLPSLPCVVLDTQTGAPLKYRYSSQDGSRKLNADLLSLSDITRAAIALLKNDKGFFIMVEGGAIDWACHKNDFATAAWETIDMNDAVRVALEFYKKHPADTLIITTADHETGGLKIIGPVAPKMLLELKSPEESESILKDLAAKKISENELFFKLSENFGLTDISDKDKTAILKCWKKNKIAGKESVAREVLRLVYAKAGIMWTTGGHTDTPVKTTAIGVGSEAFNGEYQNTHIADVVRGIIKQPAATK